MIQLAEHVRTLRVAQGYSPEYVAKRLHVSQQSYSLIERNPEECSFKRLKELAQVLNVEFLTLIGEEETFIQTNLNQSGGNAATKMVVQAGEGFAELVSYLKSEVEHLRNENSGLLKMLEAKPKK
jgi:transcriptional regulator with XRE-family HTH domain